MTTPLFPSVQRVTYRKSPLVHVICQLQFPPILRIDSQLPAGFQDSIRRAFPHFEQSRSAVLPGIPIDVAKTFGANAAGTMPVEYRFTSEDGKWSVALGQRSIALQTVAYSNWEQFSDLLELATTALTTEYAPAHFTRVGVRYIDVIHRSLLGLADRPWVDLFRREVLGELADPQLSSHVQEAGRAIRFLEPESSNGLLMQHGLIRADNQSEVAYVIDFDSYAMGSRTVESVRDEARRLSLRAAWAFRWCITDTLHNAMEPVPG